MKILSFSYCFPHHAAPQWGIFVFQRLAALAQRASLQVVSPAPYFPLTTFLRGWPGPVREQWQGLSVHRPRFFCLPGLLKSLDGRFYAQGAGRWLARFLHEYQPDILDAHFEWPDGVGVGRLAGRFGLPYAITLRGWLYEAMGRPRILPQCVQAMHDAAAIISVSGPLAETAVELGVAREKIHVIPNGVDREHFAPQDRREARCALGLPLDGRLLVSVAHLGPRKGHHETLQALTTLPEDVRLVVVGGDAQGRGANERLLRERVRKLGLTERVLLAGPQPYGRIPLYLSAADVTVLASYREGCPNVVLESLACGRPVVASRVGAVPDLIQPGVNGQIVPAQEVAPLAEALRETLDRRWSAEAIRGSEAVRPWSAVAEQAEQVLAAAARTRK